MNENLKFKIVEPKDVYKTNGMLWIALRTACEELVVLRGGAITTENVDRVMSTILMKAKKEFI